MADYGSWGVKLCRALQGFSQGFIFPCVHVLLSKWIPLSERSRFGAFVYAGKLFSFKYNRSLLERKMIF